MFGAWRVRRGWARLGMAMLLLVAPVGAGVASAADDCQIEPASQWAPQGYICPPIYGYGDASRYPGPGVARNDCVFPWTACETISIQSMETGVTIIVTPTMWCMCYVNTVGPNGEAPRIVDLDPAAVAALGLDWDDGLFPVRVQPVRGGASSSVMMPPVEEPPLPATLPNTALQP